MDWEANLAAIIKCTDANLEQQFRQFADMTGDLTTYSSYDYGWNSAAVAAGGDNGGAFGGFGGGLPFQQQQQDSVFDDSSNIGAAYFRESMASNLRHRGDYSSSGGGEGLASSRPVGMPTSFSSEFRRRQERKRSAEAPHLRTARAKSGERYDNNNDDDQENNAEFDEEFDHSANSNNDTSNTHHQYPRRAPRSKGMPYQMYNSQTYDIAQMMEQVRLSLKLEVDARAAIAERQLSALLNLCKASTEEMDRLRVEVCANDRQIHTLEQVQSKLRQELTTQKDIGFHLQSMCGKDESWRMQAENQLLELRQLVAAIREQGNSLHATSQEKLSRAKLLVQFNASIEPIKAQFQANLQHQAQQIAEITRTTSSSSLLLDALNQKVNRGLMDEITDLRNEVYALKSHVSKMNTMLDGNHSKQQQQQEHVPAASPALPVKDPAEEAEKERQKVKRWSELMEEIKSQVLITLQDRFDTKIKDLESNLELRLHKLAANQDEKMAQQQKNTRSACEERGKSLVVLVETQVKSLQQQVQNDLNGTVRDFSERLEQLKQQLIASATSLVDTKAAACQNRQIDLLKMVECKQKERRSALEVLQESCRKSRHSLEDQVHAVAHETRAKAAQVAENVESKVRDCEKSTANATQALEKELQARIESLASTIKAQSEGVSENLDAKLRALEDSLAKRSQTVTSLSAATKESVVNQAKESEKSASSATTDSNSNAKATIERETSAYLAAMEAMLQKMQLQLQLQTQAQLQAQAAQVAQMHPPPYWVSSPHYVQHSSQPPLPPQSVAYPQHQQPAPLLAPLLAQPPTTYSSGSSAVAPSPNPALVPEFKPEPQQESINASASEAKTSSANVIESKKSGTDLQPKICSSNVATPPLTPPIALEPVKPAATESQAPKTNSVPAANPSPPPAPMAGPVEKIQQTIVATAKGALAEVEMAKLRVENRRKQENELRQQQQQQQIGQQAPSQPLSEPSIASQPAAGATATGTNQKVVEQRHGAAPSHPQLSRAALMSALLPASSSLPINISGARPSEAAARDDSDDDNQHTNPPIPRPQSNSISVSVTATGIHAAPLSHSSSVPIPEPPAQAQQKVTTAQPVDTVQPSVNAAMTVNGGKPPPPPSTLPTQSPLIQRPAVSSTNETEIGPPAAALNSPRSFPPPPAAIPPPTGAAPSPAAVDYCPISNDFSVTSSKFQIKHTSHETSTNFATIVSISTTTSNSTSAESTASAAITTTFSHPELDFIIIVIIDCLPYPLRYVPPPCSHRPARGARAIAVPKRTQECKHCRAKVLWSEVDTHERDGCSSLTPRNPSTSDGQQGGQNSNVDDSETPASTATASVMSGSNSAGGSMKKCRHCNTDVVSQDLFDHELHCDKMLKQCPHCLRRQKMSELQDHIENCDCRLVLCPNNCGGKFLQRGIPKHLTTRCPNKGPATGASSSNSSGGLSGASAATSAPSQAPAALVISPPPSVPSQSQASTTPKPAATVPSAPSLSSPANLSVAAPSAAKPPVPTTSSVTTAECKFCDEEFPANEIDEHEDKCDWKPKRCQHCNMVIISRDLARHESSCKTSVKSCPHCNENMPQSALATHTARCAKRSIKCIRCCQQFPADSIVAHSTSCKFIPTSASTTNSTTDSTTATTSATQPPGGVPRMMTPATGAAGTAGRIPPPPPYPPTTQPPAAAPSTAATAPKLVAPATTPSGLAQAKPAGSAEESLSERMARRNLALSQLTKPAGAPSSTASTVASGAASASAPTAPVSTNAMRSNAPRGSIGNGPEQDDDHDIDDDGEEDEGEEDDGEEDDDDQLTLAQVVAEWNVENVCLWLHEDVGVPEVVSRFQQRQCTGEVLLDLTESDLINDFGVKNRIHRERILSAIDAIKTSDDFSDEDENEEDDGEEEEEEGNDEEEEEDDSEEGEGADTSAAQRASRVAMGEVPFMHPRDLLRRNTLPSPQRGGAAAPSLPSSSAMFRRINTALSVDFSNR